MGIRWIEVPNGQQVGGRQERRLLLLAAAGFVLLCLGIFADFFLGSDTRIASSPIGDGTRYFVFMRSFGAEQLLGGNIPLWNPHTFSGNPFVGVFQSAMFYPLNVIYLVFSLGTAINLDFAMHLVLLGLFTFAWLRGWRLHPAGAFFAAVMVMLSAPNFLRVLAGQVTVLDTLAWSPLLLLSIDGLAKRPSLGWSLVGIGATTMMILAGHPPTVFMAGVVTALYCLGPLFRSRRRLRFVLSLIPLAVAPLFLSAVQLWTGLQVGGEGLRSGGMSFDFATSFSFPPENLLTLLVPEAFGNAALFKRTYFGRWFYWDASLYLGLVGLLFAIHGALRGRSDLRKLALILVPLIVIIALGRYTPAYALLHQLIPGFGHFRAPSKFMFYAALFGAALAGIGVDRLLAEGRQARGAVIAAFCLALLLGLGLFWVWGAPPDQAGAGSPARMLARLNSDRPFSPESIQRWHDFLLRGLLLSTLAFTLAGGLLWLGRRWRWPRNGLILLGVVELFVFAHANRGGTSLFAEHTRRPYLAEAYAEAGEDRVLMSGKTSDIALQVHGYDLWGYDPVMLERYVEFMAFSQGRRVDDMNNIGGDHPSVFHPLFSMLRGRFVWWRRGEIAERPDPFPRFLLARDHRVIEDRSLILGALEEPTFDARQTVILEQPPEPPPAAGGSGGVVKLLDESTDHLSLEVELEQAAILVITDAYARGWRALALPGSAQSEYALLPANYVLRAIPLGAGRHRLRVEYSPLAYRAGAWTSTASALLFLAGVTAWYRQQRRV